MLLLTMNIGKERYAIDASRVIEVIPLVRLEHVPRVDACIAGIFNYRGQTVPVVDLCLFFNNQPCRSNLGSRIILIAMQTKIIGLLAEHVTEAIKCNESDIGNSGIRAAHAEFLGKIYKHQHEIIQIIDTEKIIPDAIARQLTATETA